MTPGLLAAGGILRFHVHAVSSPSPPRARAEVKDASCRHSRRGAASELPRRNLIQVYVLPVQLGTSRHRRRARESGDGGCVVVVLGRDPRFRNNDVYATGGGGEEKTVHGG